MKAFFCKILSFIKHRLFVIEIVNLYFYDSCNPTSINQIDIREASESNLKDILSFQDSSYIDLFNSFLNSGDRGYFAYLDDECVHRSWVKSNDQYVYPHWIYPMKLKSNQHFIHYCETSPKARGRGIYPAVLSKISLDYKDKGELLICVDSRNKASIKGVVKAGFVKKEIIFVVVLFGARFVKRINVMPVKVE